MNWQWLTMTAIVAALAIGYSVLSRRDDDGALLTERPVLQGYYLKDAVITETSEMGAPRVRFAAIDAKQDLDAHRFVMTGVRADYVWGTDQQHKHWVLNANNLVAPLDSIGKSSIVELHGDVDAHSADDNPPLAIKTQSLTIDTGAQIATTNDAVAVTIDRHAAHGRGLRVELQREHVQIHSDVALQFAANSVATQAPLAPPRTNVASSLPQMFYSDSFDYQNNVLVMTKVRSKDPPFISADQLRATGKDIENNKVDLSGSVRMELPKRGLLLADTATITVNGGRMQHAQVAGNPVEFQHQSETGDRLVKGHARHIDYDVNTQILRFGDDAWFNNGKFEITSDLIEYNLATEAARGTRVEGSVTPRKSDSNNKTQ